LQQPWISRHIRQRLGSRLDASPQVKETKEEHLICPQTNDTGCRCGNGHSHPFWCRYVSRIDQPISYDDVDRARHFHSRGPACDSRDPTNHHRHHIGTDNNNYHHQDDHDHHNGADAAGGHHRTSAASKSAPHRLRAAFPTLRKAVGPNCGSYSEQQQLEQ
jgi:hypothetical protein